MFVTKDTLIKYGACEEGIAFFERFAPNGAELSDMIQFKHVPHDFLHWLINNLTTTEDERALYHQMLGNINSTGLYNSEKVVNGTYVVESKNVTNSSYVYKSQDIELSHYVSLSNNVKESTNVSGSEYVFNSIEVNSSSNVKQSEGITKSSLIIESSNVYGSGLITRSSMIYDSHSIVDSSFISNCERLDHCLFCHKSNDAKYQLFNVPILPEQFDFIYNEFQMFHLPVISTVCAWENNWTGAITPTYNRYKHTAAVCDDEHFMKWVKTLPNYSPDILYNITFSERVFK